jgi:hypothetical protein
MHDIIIVANGLGRRQITIYGEQAGKEVGFYQDPVSDYGRTVASAPSVISSDS